MVYNSTKVFNIPFTWPVAGPINTRVADVMYRFFENLLISFSWIDMDRHGSTSLIELSKFVAVGAGPVAADQAFRGR